MAFINNYEDDSGNTYSAAYFRIVILEIDWADLNAELLLYVYKDKDARLANKKQVSVQSCSFGPVPNESGVGFDDFFSKELLDLPSFNPVEALYDHLMSLPQHAGSVADL